MTRFDGVRLALGCNDLDGTVTATVPVPLVRRRIAQHPDNGRWYFERADRRWAPFAEGVGKAAALALLRHRVEDREVEIVKLKANPRRDRRDVASSAPAVKYTAGYCAEYALALSDLRGLTVAVLYQTGEEKPLQSGRICFLDEPLFIHAVCVSPGGDYCDVEGRHTRAELDRRWATPTGAPRIHYVAPHWRADRFVRLWPDPIDTAEVSLARQLLQRKLI